MEWITANDIAGDDLNAQKNCRPALRAANLPWHMPNARWNVELGSGEHRDTLRVYKEWRERPN